MPSRRSVRIPNGFDAIGHRARHRAQLFRAYARHKDYSRRSSAAERREAPPNSGPHRTRPRRANRRRRAAMAMPGVAAIFQRKRDAHRDGSRAADDRAAVNPALPHVRAPSSRQSRHCTRRLAVKLGDHLPKRRAFGEIISVRAIMRDNVVVRPQQSGKAVGVPSCPMQKCIGQRISCSWHTPRSGSPESCE